MTINLYYFISPGVRNTHFLRPYFLNQGIRNMYSRIFPHQELDFSRFELSMKMSDIVESYGSNVLAMWPSRYFYPDRCDEFYHVIFKQGSNWTVVDDISKIRELSIAKILKSNFIQHKIIRNIDDDSTCIMNQNYYVNGQIATPKIDGKSINCGSGDFGSVILDPDHFRKYYNTDSLYRYFNKYELSLHTTPPPISL